MIEHLGLDAWERYDARHPAPTFFARPAWALALAQTYPAYRPMPLRVRYAAGRSAIVPLVATDGGRLHWRELSGFPLGAYTCVLDEERGAPVDAQIAQTVLAQIAREYDVVRVVPWPLAPIPMPSGAQTRAHTTAVIDLSRGLDAALARVSGVSRRMAGQAQRRGVTCEIDRSPSAVDTYYGLLEASAVRWGIERPAIPKRLLDALVRYGGDDVEVWFARHDGEAIAGGVVFYGSEELFFWTAAMRAEHGRLRPSNALNVALLHAAAARGVRWYNLGSSEGLPGVARFKHDLGAVEIAYEEAEYHGLRYSVYSRVRGALGKRRSA